MSNYLRHVRKIIENVLRIHNNKITQQLPYTQEEALEVVNQIYNYDTKIQLKAKIKKQWPCKFTPKEAYYWGKYIGDRRIMIDLVTESWWAYKWACDIGDREVMRERVTDSGSAFLWAKNIGDRVLMRNRITSSYWAYQWAIRIGDREIMRKRVTDPKWKKQFESFFPKTKKN